MYFLLALRHTVAEFFAFSRDISVPFFPKSLLFFNEKRRTTGMIYAYARVSARDQNLERQLDAFETFGIERKCIFCDKKSGKDFDRANYLRLVKKLKHGDLLVIKSIDRLGRNYKMVVEEWNRITNIIRADILVLDMPLLDTRSGGDTLVGRFISDLVLQILSFVAENERANIRARQAEGIAAAKKKGVRFGRPNKIYTDRFLKTASAFCRKQISLKQALADSGMTVGNFYYHLRRLGQSGALPQPTDRRC